MKLTPAQRLILEDSPELLAEFLPDFVDGKDGKDGQKGEKGEPGKDGLPGQNGKNGLDGKDGLNGVDGLDGKDGKDGRNGSPDTPETIAKKLNTLENAIDASVIKDGVTRKEVEQISSGMKVIDGRIKLIDQRWHGGGKSNGSGSSQTLAQTLAIGNVTGGTDIIVSTGDKIVGQTDLLLQADATGNNYYYAGPTYLFQQWSDGLGMGNTDFLYQGAGTQLFSHTSIDIQTDTGLYGFFNGTTNSGKFDFTGINTTDKTFTWPNMSGTVALTSDIPAALWSRDISGTPFLYPTNSGDNVRLNSIAAPNDAQFNIKANGLGTLELLNYGAGDQEIHFDVEWVGGGYVAQNTTIGGFFEYNNQLQFYINDGQTVGMPATADFNTPKMVLDVKGNLGLGITSLNGDGSSIFMGTVANSGIFDGSNRKNSFLGGFADNSGQIRVTADNSFVLGKADGVNASLITGAFGASSWGLAQDQASGNTVRIYSGGYGDQARGLADYNAIIQTSGGGASGSGRATGSSSASAYLQATSAGGNAFGDVYAVNVFSILGVNGSGGMSHGYVQDGSISSSTGSEASGYVQGASGQSATIGANGTATRAMGYVISSGTVSSNLTEGNTGGDINGYVSDSYVSSSSSGGKHWIYASNNSNVSFSGNGSGGGGSVNNNGYFAFTGEAAFGSVYANGSIGSYQAQAQVTGNGAALFGSVQAYSNSGNIYGGGSASLSNLYSVDSSVYNYGTAGRLSAYALNNSYITLGNSASSVNVAASYGYVSSSSDGGIMSGSVQGTSSYTSYLQSSNNAILINGFVNSSVLSTSLSASGAASFTSASLTDATVYNNAESGFLMGQYTGNSSYNTSVTQGTSSNFLIARANANTAGVTINQTGQAEMTNAYMEGGTISNSGLATFTNVYTESANGYLAQIGNTGSGTVLIGRAKAVTSAYSTLSISGSGSMVGAYVIDNETTTSSGDNSLVWGNGLSNSGSNNFLFGSGITNSNSNTHIVGWNGLIGQSISSSLYNLYYPGTSVLAMVVDYGAGDLTLNDTAGAISISATERSTYDTIGNVIMDWGAFRINYTNGMESVAFGLGRLGNVAGSYTVDYDNSQLLGAWEVTGLLTGTSIIAAGGEVDAGASGTTGQLRIYPSGVSKGYTQYLTTSNAGNTVTQITTAAQAGARVYTVTDAGANADFVLDTTGTRISATIVTAKLTALGTNGSMTFTNGVLTASTPAT